MEEEKLITIAKPGEPKLQILSGSLEEHEKLGWTWVDDEKPSKKKSASTDAAE
jgi:hypothetical protein